MAAPDRSMRADARRNRDRLAEAAAELFAQEGSDVSLEAVARRAGVGIGTLYRHFPTRGELVVAAYRSEVEHLCEAAEELLDALPPDAALEAWMRRFVDYIAAKRGMSGALAEIVAAGSDVRTAAGEQIVSAVERLLRAGQEAGTLRTDVEAVDVMRAMSPVYSISETPGWTEQAHRLLRVLMDGLRHRAA